MAEVHSEIMGISKVQPVWERECSWLFFYSCMAIFFIWSAVFLTYQIWNLPKKFDSHNKQKAESRKKFELQSDRNSPSKSKKLKKHKLLERFIKCFSVINLCYCPCTHCSQAAFFFLCLHHFAMQLKKSRVNRAPPLKPAGHWRSPWFCGSIRLNNWKGGAKSSLTVPGQVTVKRPCTHTQVIWLILVY